MCRGKTRALSLGFLAILPDAPLNEEEPTRRSVIRVVMLLWFEIYSNFIDL
jgi:hypothetical protein